MASVTYYVAPPFIRTEYGGFVAGEAQERQTPNAAMSLALTISETSAGAVAFSRTGDPDVGDFADAVMLATFGEVPRSEDLLSGGWLARLS